MPAASPAPPSWPDRSPSSRPPPPSPSASSPPTPTTPALLAQESAAADLGTASARHRSGSATPRAPAQRAADSRRAARQQAASSAAPSRPPPRAPSRTPTAALDHDGPQPVVRRDRAGRRSSARSTPASGSSSPAARPPSRVEIVLDGESRWVTAGYLSEEKPVAGIGGDCTNGTSVASGRQPQHRQGPRGGLRGVPRDHHLRHLPRRRRARPGHRGRHHGLRRARAGRSRSSSASTTPSSASPT